MADADADDSHSACGDGDCGDGQGEQTESQTEGDAMMPLAATWIDRPAFARRGDGPRRERRADAPAGIHGRVGVWGFRFSRGGYVPPGKRDKKTRGFAESRRMAGRIDG